MENDLSQHDISIQYGNPSTPRNQHIQQGSHAHAHGQATNGYT